MFYCMFYFTCDRSLTPTRAPRLPRPSSLLRPRTLHVSPVAVPPPSPAAAAADWFDEITPTLILIADTAAAAVLDAANVWPGRHRRCRHARLTVTIRGVEETR